MNSERSVSVTDARGIGKDFGRLSDLHPGGFGHVPRALLRHPESHAVHLGVFAAISETARGLPQPDGGYRWLASGLSRADLRALTGIRKADTLRAKIRELEAWGFILEIRRPNAPSDFEILPTDQSTNLTHLPPPAVPARGVLQAAPDTHHERTNDLGEPVSRVLQAAPDTHLPSGSSAGVPVEGALRQGAVAMGGRPLPAAQVPALPVHQSPAPPGEGVVLSYTDKRPNQTCRCAEPHPPFLTHKQYMVLKKANRRRYVDAAIEEVSFRLGNASIAPEIRQPYTMVRNIAECYSGRCRSQHGDYHGEDALMYHRGRRADVEQLLRSKGGSEPDPGSLGPLKEIIDEIFAEGSSQAGDDIEGLEQRRAYFLAALAGMQREDEAR